MLRGHCAWVSPGICSHSHAGTGGKQGGCTRMVQQQDSNHSSCGWLGRDISWRVVCKAMKPCRHPFAESDHPALILLLQLIVPDIESLQTCYR